MSSLFNTNNYNKPQESILNKQALNGRVNLITEPSPEVRFKMQEKVAAKNKSSEYRNALAGELENNMLSNVFFSAENVQILQNGIRAGVHKASKEEILVPPQNVDTLKIIMRSTYLQYAEHRLDKITQEVERLNKLVLNYCVPNVHSAAISYRKYLEDQSTIAMPMERPRNHDRDYKQLELKHFM
jgi:hypothetical protein|uniref:Minor capsid protein P8 central region domain-containing protein n=1 Tax=viral metagenome TaxID=1070528 RepID=A0A6C0INI1_9ZZZZ